jgi:thiamine biosynthesis lipoprotein
VATETPTRREALRITAVAGIGLALAGVGVAELVRLANLHRVSVTRTQLGTAVTVTVVHPDADEAHAIVNGALNEIERLEGVFSRYRPETPVARLNREGRVTDAPGELLEIVSSALDYSRMTGGAFDVTVAPVLNLYVSRFAVTDVPPTDAEVSAAMALVGWQGLRVNGRTIVLERPGMAITLDAIAKGFVVDRAVATLTAAGADRVIVDAGGDMATRANGDDPWQVAIQDPHDSRGSLGVVQLRGESLASSGDYMQYFTPDRRLNHTIDPRTGRSPQHSSGSTVKAPTAMDADALSTAVFVLGPREGIALLDRMERVEGMLVTKTGELFASRGFLSDSAV